MTYDINSPPGWLAAIYRDELNRAPDLTGMFYWIGVRDGGRSEVEIRKGIHHSEEATALRK